MAKAGTTGITAGVVVAQHAGHGQIQLAQQSRNPGPAVAEIAHHQQGIRADLLQNRMVAVIPLIVEVTGDGDLQHAQRLALLRLIPSCPTRGPG